MILFSQVDDDRVTTVSSSIANLMARMRYVLSAQYFLWFAALTGILPYVSIFAKNYSNASATQIGILYTVLPFVAMITKPIFCGLADRFSSHKLTLAASMGVTLFGYGILVLAPWFDAANWSLWFICSSVFIANTAMGIVITMNDSIAMREVAAGRATFGSLRVFGTLGWGIIGLVVGVLNESDVLKSHLPYLLPGVIVFIAIMSIDILLIIWCYHDPSNSIHETLHPVTTVDGANTDTHDNASKNIVKHVFTLFSQYPSLIYYSFIVFVVGFLTSFHWSFFFWYVEDMAGQDTILMGLCSAVQSFLGELPFFLLSNWIVKTVGYNNALTISLGSIALRYLCYGYLIQTKQRAYFILFVELLQGPAYGLFYVVMTAIAQDFSMKYVGDTSDNHVENNDQSNSKGDHRSKGKIPNYDKITPSNRHHAQNCPISAMNRDDGGQVSGVNDVHGERVESSKLPGRKTSTVVDTNGKSHARENTDGATVDSSEITLQVDCNCDILRRPLNPLDHQETTYATMQGFFSALFEGAGLGLGALVAGLLIDTKGSAIAWRFAGYLSFFVCIGNFLVNLNLEKCSS